MTCSAPLRRCDDGTPIPHTVCDLHTHSNYSDGSLSPGALVRLAEARGIAALALTDHNTARGLPEFTQAGKNSSVRVVPGCEFSTDGPFGELHIVGLFLPAASWEQIAQTCAESQRKKAEANRLMIERLRGAGYPITEAEAEAQTNGETFNRAHVARMLVSKGCFKTVADVFKGPLSKSAGFYEPLPRPDAYQVIRFIRSIGGVSVLAHPFSDMNAEQAAVFLPTAKTNGLDAMETRYSGFDEQTSRLASALAERFGLLQSGGSDYHGEAKPDVALGTGSGDLRVPFSFYETLADLASSR